MKKLLSLALVLALLLCLLPVGAMAYSVVLSPQNLTVDGRSITCEKYNIDGANYFKLRDLAYLLSGTPAQFDVSWDAAANAIVIAPGFAYAPVGGELAVGLDRSATAVPSSQSVWYLDAPVTDLSIYNIGGNNYFKLRDLGNLLGFGVDYDAATNTAVVLSGGPVQTAAELNAEQVFAKCAPAVVFVTVYDSNHRAFATGSGFFIEQSGVLVTNYHVIDGCSYATVQTSDTGAVYDVLGVYACNETEDWAVVQVDGSGFTTLPIGGANTVVGGAKAYAIGSPLGLQNTISEGIISNPGRTLDGVSYIQTDSAISHGSSGGALINKYGQVIGITAAGFDEGQNLNLAVPMTYVKYSVAAGYTPLAQVTGRTGTAVVSAPTSVNSTADALKVLQAYLVQQGASGRTYGDDGTPVNLYYLDYTDDSTGTVFSIYYEDQYGGTALEMWMPLDEAGEVDAWLFLSGMDESGDRADTSLYITDYSTGTECLGEAWIGRKTILSQSTVSFYNFEGQISLSRSECEEISCASMQLIIELSDVLFEYFGIPLTIADFGFAGGAGTTGTTTASGNQAAAFNAMKQWIIANANDVIGDANDPVYFDTIEYDDGDREYLGVSYAPDLDNIVLICGYSFADGDMDYASLYLTPDSQSFIFIYSYSLSGQSAAFYEGGTMIVPSSFNGSRSLSLTKTGGSASLPENLQTVAEFATVSASEALWFAEKVFSELMYPAGAYSMADFGFNVNVM